MNPKTPIFYAILLAIFLFTACSTASVGTSEPLNPDIIRNTKDNSENLVVHPDPGTATLYEEIVRSSLPDLGPAPEITNQVWLNTEEPHRLEDLRGNVVLLEMWTFG